MWCLPAECWRRRWHIHALLCIQAMLKWLCYCYRGKTGQYKRIKFCTLCTWYIFVCTFVVYGLQVSTLTLPNSAYPAHGCACSPGAPPGTKRCSSDTVYKCRTCDAMRCEFKVGSRPLGRHNPSQEDGKDGKDGVWRYQAEHNETARTL